MRALGINAVMGAGFEAANAYGTPPNAGTYKKLPFVSSQLGEEQGLIEDDQLGFGREGLDPTYDVITNDGDVVVPMDTRAIGFWLKLLFGPPVSTVVTPAAGDVPAVYSHTFTSGAAALPSASIEIGLPDMPNFEMNFGARANQLKTSLTRSGMLNATISLVAQGTRVDSNVSTAGALTALQGPRFAQATGSIMLDDVVLGGVVAADVAYSNQLDKVETIRADGRIEDADPGAAMATGSVTIKFASRALKSKASAQVPVKLSFGWTNGAASLVFTLPRVFLPKPKNSVDGPKGVQAVYNYQASGAGGHKVIAVLTNDVTAY